MDIEVRGLSKAFEEVKALDALSLNITPGITGLIGQNGAGKSTFLRLLAGTISPSEGSIKILGHEGGSQEAKKNVFFLPDNPYTPGGASMDSLLAFYSIFYDIDHEKYEKLLAKTLLNRKRKIATFSKGMKRQAYLILALSIKVPVLLIDEGFDGLDPLILVTIKEELANLANEEKIVILSSHNLQSLADMATQFVLLSKGHIGEVGSEEEFSESIAKYQAAFEGEMNEEILRSFGFKVISYRQIGKIINFVIRKDDERMERFAKERKPILLEKVPATSEEIFAAEMAFQEQKNGGESHD